MADALARFHEPVRAWFSESLGAPTRVQREGWRPIVEGKSALLLAPTGSGKTLAAFLAALDRLSFSEEPKKKERLRVLYVSPLKALVTDVERNLKSPITGIARAAERLGMPFRTPTVAMRTGDTPAKERAAFLRAPADILVTTPESFYLLLTSQARERLATVDTVIVDEIHSLVATKRGAHLFLSLERLQALCPRPLQRIGLSATQRPLNEVARLLGGGELSGSDWRQRPVEIVDAGSKKQLTLSVEVPVEDMSAAAAESPERSLWPSIHPRLVELIRAHQSTMIFVNSRRLAERLAGAINELAGDELALAHHGSLAREQRVVVEDRLKRGTLPAIVATSSLELGIDMGAVDLVIQIESPPSVASGMQRIGRAGHSVGAPSEGVILPKHKGDLLACAAATKRMVAGEVEPILYPRNPLDVLAQQIVAMTAMDSVSVDHVFDIVRRAAPFAELPRSSFEGVLDMLSGRYPSDEFAELRPRVTWDRVGGVLSARRGARRLAVVNAGTIPDRGLYGVFLADGGAEKSRRVGELDEEMVFESRPGEIFLLGASSWRIDDITHDRVLVTPAPGEPGKLPFWHGDRPGRAPELGRAIGELARKLSKEDVGAARKRLESEHGFDARAATNLVGYLAEQREASGVVPSDRELVVERFIDEIGDWRVCLLSPYGARVHAPWALAVAARYRRETGTEVESIWSDDGIVLRFPEADDPPDSSLFAPPPEEVNDAVVEALGTSALFAARFRENAGRALLLPRRHPGKRSPLWAQRKRASDLLQVAARYGSFPIMLETYRECLRDVFDVPALVDLLRRVQSRQVRLTTVDSKKPSPFSATLLFGYVANFMYEGDAPLAERRAQALTIDQAQLRELLGEAELRELLDPDVIAEVEREVQRLTGYRVRDADGVHDLLLSLGPLSADEIAERSEGFAQQWLTGLLASRRVLSVTIGGQTQLAAAEDAARLRDAVGVMPPPGLPEAFLEAVADPLGDLVARYARTHGPFRVEDAAARLGVLVALVRTALERLAAEGRVVEGELLPGGRGREWCGREVLRRIKQRSLARLRREVEPVEPAAYARFLMEWQGVTSPAAGADALLAAVEQLSGAPLPASVLEQEIFPARVRGFRPSDLDLLCASGEIVWRGLEPLGVSDGRIALYPADQYRLLAPRAEPAAGELPARLRDAFARRGAVFFHDLVAEVGGFAQDVLDALWQLVWAGEVTNDTLEPLRSLSVPDKRRHRGRPVRTRRVGPPGSEGRWSLLPAVEGPSETERRTALASALLERWGVLPREAVHAEGVSGGFSAVYPVLKAMEEAGRVRRGYFVAGLGATQFARPGADDRLRAVKNQRDARTQLLAATDPANPYGSVLPWPEHTGRPARMAGARVVLWGGALVGFVSKGERAVLSFLPHDEPERAEAASALCRALSDIARERGRRALVLSEIDGAPPAQSPLAEPLRAAGFVPGGSGFIKRTTYRDEEPLRARG
ncbi:MAG: DEAD/DEAH box helicase [Polyangiaceae bacterium]|nr:DEAD/DEAH box helicase [Polyangiaceae bacterium]